MATRPPLDLSEGLVTRHLLRDPETGERIEDAPISGLATAMTLAREKAQAAAALFDAIKDDATMTPEANALRSRESIVKLAGEVTKALDTARDKARAEIRRVEFELSAPPVPRDPVGLQIEGEVRAALRGMTEEKRTSAIEAALNGDDDLTIGALLRGPAMLSGVSDAQRTLYAGQWRRKRFPTETARLQRLTKAVADVERGGKAFLDFVRTLTESPTAKVAAAKQGRVKTALEAAAIAAE